MRSGGGPMEGVLLRILDGLSDCITDRNCEFWNYWKSNSAWNVPGSSHKFLISEKAFPHKTRSERLMAVWEVATVGSANEAEIKGETRKADSASNNSDNNNESVDSDINIPSDAVFLYQSPKKTVFEKLKHCLKALCCCKRRVIAPMSLKRQFGEGDIALSFSGCGFLGAYHFGVLQGLTRDGKELMKRVKRCGGASAGSLAAALYVFTPGDAQKGYNDVIKMATEIHKLRFGALSASFMLHKSLQKLVECYIPEDISSAQGRLYISVTHQKRKANRLISQFPSRDYLVECLLASCYIPMYSGASPPIIDGDQYIDGGFTCNLPVFEELPTVTISPFSGSALIAPNDRNPLKPFREWRLRIGAQELKVNVQNMVRGAQALFPPNIDILKNYYEMGQRDAMKFLLEVGVMERQKGDAV